MMKNNERMVLVLDCEVMSSTNGVDLPSISDLSKIWGKYIDNGRAVFDIRNNTAILTACHIDRDQENNITSILVRISDKLAPNAVYSDIRHGVFTEYKKSDNEGNDVCCHFFVSETQEAAKPNTYTCMVEQSQGLSHREVRRILNSILHVQYKEDPSVFEVDDPRGRRLRDGTPKKVVHLPRIELRGRPSQSFIRDIERGRLSGVTLIKSEPQTPVAGSAFLRHKEKRLCLSIDHGNIPENLWADITATLTRTSKEFSRADISFSEKDTKKSYTVKISTDTATPTEDPYIESVHISPILPVMAHSSEKIVSHFADMVKKHLAAKRKP